jgi:polyisoprenoid-binding protein YceI
MRAATHVRMFGVSGLCLSTVLAFAGALRPADTEIIGIESGTVSFDVVTNALGYNFAVSSNAIKGSLELSRDTSGLVLQKMDYTLPVESLSSGINVRDEHMRQQVFTTKDGQIPDLRFVADKAPCPAKKAPEFACKISGSLTIRGIARPFSVDLKVKELAGEARRFQAVATGEVKLGDYGISQPSFLGVKTANKVLIRVEVGGKNTP